MKQSTESNVYITGIPETLTKEQAGTQLHCSLQTLDRMIAGGKLRAYKIGRRKVLINADDVRAFFIKPSNFRVID